MVVIRPYLSPIQPPYLDTMDFCDRHHLTSSRKAPKGVITVINIGDVRSVFTMVSTSSIQALHLPQLRSADLETWFGKGHSEFNGSDQRKEK